MIMLGVHRAGRGARGFTLVELIVAGLVTALVAGGASVALAQVLRVRASVDSRAESARVAEMAAEKIARDVRGTLRDGDLFYVMFRVIDGGDAERGEAEFDELMLFTRSDERARGIDEQPESGEFEVQYRVAPGPGPGGQVVDFGEGSVGGFGARDAGLTLWRRLDPMPDEVPDGGGLVRAVVDGVTRLRIEAFDGSRWRDEWDSDRDGLPHAVRVLVEARVGEGTLREVAMRTVAIDRVPVPFVTISGASGGGSGDENGGGR